MDRLRQDDLKNASPLPCGNAQATDTVRQSKIGGLLLGTAVGDALGLAREGLSARRAARIFAGPPLSYELLCGRGLCSDDTEHACLIAQSLLAAPSDCDAFRREFAWRLRWWLLGAPAGIGWATLRSILKLWLGFPPTRSGVRSAGNGPAMRSAVIGACFAGRNDLLVAYVTAATRLTHVDPRALDGAMAVALAAQDAVLPTGGAADAAPLLERIECQMTNVEFGERLRVIAKHLQRQSAPAEVAAEFGLRNGVTGYVLDTVPVALFCWLRFRGDFRRAAEQVILLGGDTDTTAAIVGALAGADGGIEAIPREWRDGMIDWPRSRAWIEKVAERLTRQFASCAPPAAIGPQPLFWPALIPRNLLFAVVVVLHALRRMLPPY